MSEQDATDEERPDGDPADGAAGADDLDDIAEEPDGDPDDALDDITGESRPDDETEAGDETDDGPDEELVERVAESEPDDIAAELDALRNRVAELEDALTEREDTIEDLESRLARKQADFQNYKKRQKKRMEEEKQRATEDLVQRLLDVRDNLKRALDQGEDANIRGGVESTLRQFDEELDRENVEAIEPEPGEEVDPQRHEALATIASDQPADSIAELHRPGYEMAGKVIRPAQVAVSDGSEHGE